MPRFSDEWLIDRTLFDYVQGGSCACCSFNFLPSGTKGLIESMSEFETDAANAEVSALARLPWPSDMKDSVWMERVRLRQFFKKNMHEYRDFWKEHGDAYSEWLCNTPKKQLRRMFQLARSEVVERLNAGGYQMHGSFGTVLHAVIEQVAHFEITKYPTDGRGEAEVGFEEILMFDRRGGFTLKDIDSDATKQAWLLRHKALGGPKLLERNVRKRGSDDDDDDDDDEGGADDGDYEPKSDGASDTPSFRSDRRITRLVIARHFADALQKAYLKSIEPKDGEEAKES